jgi:hypothetical protein
VASIADGAAMSDVTAAPFAGFLAFGDAKPRKYLSKRCKGYLSFMSVLGKFCIVYHHVFIAFGETRWRQVLIPLPSWFPLMDSN